MPIEDQQIITENTSVSVLSFKTLSIIVSVIISVWLFVGTVVSYISGIRNMVESMGERVTKLEQAFIDISSMKTDLTTVKNDMDRVKKKLDK